MVSWCDERVKQRMNSILSHLWKMGQYRRDCKEIKDMQPLRSGLVSRWDLKLCRCLYLVMKLANKSGFLILFQLYLFCVLSWVHKYFKYSLGFKYKVMCVCVWFLVGLCYWNQEENFFVFCSLSKPYGHWRCFLPADP